MQRIPKYANFSQPKPTYSMAKKKKGAVAPAVAAPVAGSVSPPPTAAVAEVQKSLKGQFSSNIRSSNLTSESQRPTYLQSTHTHHPERRKEITSIKSSKKSQFGLESLSGSKRARQITNAATPRAPQLSFQLRQQAIHARIQGANSRPQCGLSHHERLSIQHQHQHSNPSYSATRKPHHLTATMSQHPTPPGGHTSPTASHLSARAAITYSSRRTS